ncbi:TRPM8 channel-associated factor homolog [Poeciliopsis prolifica]|uniref:TRPM8 channel-associated factor homolog n=1 Tax=Poeciliopsis prolifica TaxID=188132 RepID=UPI002413B047|nr:TRPM8 channel-associated factor homolog [Poeciliopsis prolifica]XP_054884918.1 TRPM8 channel-associated factor homolog [Poeciliopsis prolifica]XP_054884919.1 TRPM8 channel-associated factor homolog [Poeciliopsis prolifica]
MSNQSTQSYPQDAYKALMRGIQKVDLQHSSVPCNLVLTGDAFPVVMNSQGHILMAASVYGRGRIVVLSHETYLTLCPALVDNALTWLGGGKSANLSLGVSETMKGVVENLNRSTYKVRLVEKFRADLGVGVYVTDAYPVGPKAEELIAFMKAGGGLLIGGQAWWWASQNEDKNLILEFSGNKVTGVAGIYFSAQYGKAENLPISPEIPSSWKTIDCAMDFKKDLEFLLNGISDFDIKGDGLPSEALVHGPLAFPIGTTDKRKAFLAGSYYGRGRIIVVTHESFLQYEKLASFWKNAFDWLDQGRKGVVGFEPCIKPLSNLGLTCKKTNFREEVLELSVFVCTAYIDMDAELIQNFVVNGGGLLMGGHAWYWASTHIGQNPMQDFSGNKILSKMGLGLLTNTIKADVYKAPDPTQVNKFHFRHLLHRFAGHALEGIKLTKEEEENLKKLGSETALFLKIEDYDCISYVQILSLLTDILKKEGVQQASEQNPVKSPKEHGLLSLATSVYDASLNQEELLPYIIKDNPPLPVVKNQQIMITAQTGEHEEWISTGLYLSPGMKTEIILPAKFVNKRWKIQIGCQSDELHDEKLRRAPYVIKSFPIASERVQVWNLWGGLIYLLAPRDVKVENEKIVVQEAITAPYYKSGATKEADWSSLRKAPAPWAEMEFENIILTVPSHIIRDLENVLEVEKLWNAIMKGVADLAVIPQKFIRKERIVADVQISAGWMHSGYPIMMHSSIGAELFNPQDARTKGLWGEIHELGHNQQRSPWEFPPHTTEATCNLWSVYVHEEVLGLDRAKAHPSITAASRKRSVEEYIEGGKKLSDWKVWTALETYLQLQEKFGWDAFKKVFATYHDMTNHPSDNEGKMNLYAETLSRVVNMNLTGFFKAWGWPIQKTTEKKLSNLPLWTDHSMA